MAEIPHLWRAYAAHQSRLDDRCAADSVSWGSEAALNFLLQADDLMGATGAVSRAAAAGARRSRYSRALLAKFIIICGSDGVESGRIEARSRLSDLRRSLPADQLDLLVETALGIEPAEIAIKSQVSIGCIRARVCRARQVARDIAA